MIMGSQDQAKAQKKADKAQAKLDKKAAKARAKSTEVAVGAPAAAADHAAGPSPAERSAAAAERQVRLQRWRVILALAAMLVALLTFLYTPKPWRDDLAPQQRAPATVGDPAP